MKFAPSCSLCRALAALLALGAIARMQGAVEFSSYVKAEGGMKFILAEPDAKKKSDLLALGGVFEGYTVIGFDAKREVLSVEKAGTVSALPLQRPAAQRVVQTEEPLLNSPYTLAPRMEDLPVPLFGPDGASPPRRTSDLDETLRLLPHLDLSGGGTIRILEQPMPLTPRTLRGQAAGVSQGGIGSAMAGGGPAGNSFGGGGPNPVRPRVTTMRPFGPQPPPTPERARLLKLEQLVEERKMARERQDVLGQKEPETPEAARAELEGVWQQIREIERQLEAQQAQAAPAAQK